MKYDPSQATQLLQTDRARFFVIKADEHQKEVEVDGKKVKKESVKLFLRLINKEGLKGQCTAFLATADQIKDFIFSTGGTDQDFQVGKIDAVNCVNLEGECVIKIEEYNGSKKNSVVRYLPFKAQEVDPFNDEIPFP